jgi:hypothetical protein
MSVAVSGSPVVSGACRVEGETTVCRLASPPGTYDIRLTAPGFQEKALTVTVVGSAPPCACVTVQPQQLSVSLVPL